MATSWTNIPKAAQEGVELLVNGNFNGNANGWDLGDGWAYGSNNVVFTLGGLGDIDQNVTLVEGQVYTIQFYVGPGTGSVAVEMAGIYAEFPSGSGTVTVTGVAEESDSSINFYPVDETYAGSISAVSAALSTGGAWTDIAEASGTSYTDIAKPTDGSTIIYSGTPIGLLLALTYAQNIIIGGNWTEVPYGTASWTKISDNASSWTNIPKAT